MPPLRTSLLAILLFSSAAFGITPTARAQEEAPSAPTVVQDPALDERAVQARIDEVETTQGLDEKARQAALDDLRSALKDNESAEAFEERTAAFRRSIVEDPGAAQAIRAELEAAPGQPEVTIAEGLTPVQARNERDREQSALSAARDELGRQEAALQAIRDRPRDAEDEQDEATDDLARITSSLAAPPAEGVPEVLLAARRVGLVARRHALSRKLQMLEQELLSLPMQLQLATANRDRLQRRVEERVAAVATLDQVVARLQRDEAEAARQRAERESEAAADQHPLVRAVAQQNAVLSQELTAVVAEQQPADDARDRTEAQLERVQEMNQRVGTKLEQSGLRGLSGDLLRKQRDGLTGLRGDLDASERRWRGRSTAADGRRLELYLMQRDLADLDAATEAFVGSARPPLEGSDRDAAATEVRRLLESRRELVGRLDESHRDLLRDLQELERHQGALESEIDAVTSLLDAALLWIPSTEPPGRGTAARLVEGIGWLLSPIRWWRAAGVLVGELAERWPLTVLIALLLALLVSVRKPAQARLLVLAGEVRRVSTDRLAFTWQALGLLLALAVPWPLLLYLLGLALEHGGAESIGLGLMRAAVVVFVLGFLTRLCAPRGVGELHFKWRAPATALLRQHLSWVRWPLIVSTFLVCVTNAEPDAGFRDSLGRFGFLLGAIALLVFWQRILRPGGDLVRPLLERRRESWLSRLRWAWYLAVLGATLGFVVLAYLGYYDTALAFDGSMFETILLCLVVLLLRAATVRWLLIEQRRMAIAQFRERREAAASGETAADDESEIDLVDNFQVDLSTVNEQTRRLVRMASALALLGGAWVIWRDVLPALGVLDGVDLWPHQATGPDGEAVIAWTTLQDVLLAFVVLVLTASATANIPGLLQVAVLPNLPLEPGIRYAVVTIVRYVLVIIGMIAAFNLLGFNWSRVQWLVAAVGVGIGFGLQEIIANFACGLILLFERPIRIGDSVTIGGTSGTVSRIRMRATTITDWDRKEMVIPNKELIIGRVLNWTLSSKLNRVTIPIGVACEADPARVRRLLVEVARSHPKVIDDPAPFASFDGFGASTLDFVLFAFLADFEGRGDTISELRIAIAAALGEAGIEMPFPQVDLHLRSAEAVVRVEDGAAPAARPDAAE